MDAAEGGVESILSWTPFFALVRCVVARTASLMDGLELRSPRVTFISRIRDECLNIHETVRWSSTADGGPARRVSVSGHDAQKTGKPPRTAGVVVVDLTE